MKPVLKQLALIAIVLPGLLSAQVSTGTPPFGSFGGGPFDVINLGNLNVHLSIPVLHKAGRGVPFYYDLIYDSSIWYQATISGVVQWAPTSDWGWTSGSYAVLGRVVPTTTSITATVDHCTSTTSYTTYAYLDPKRRSHPFPGSTEVSLTICLGTGGSPHYGPGFSATATDGSGYNFTVTVNESTGATTFNVVTRSGITVYNGNGTYTDANGNQLTVNNSTGQFFDTLSSATPLLTQAGSGTPTSPVTYTYTAPSGANAAYTVSYTQYTVQTAFGVSGVTEYGPKSNALVSSIQLPDGSQYQFTYETTPGSCTPLSGTYSSNCVTGRIASVAQPTGGVITYTYSGGSNGIESDGSTAGLTRMLTATITAPAQSWTYTRELVGTVAPGPGSTWTTTVIDPNSDYTVVNFAEDSTVTNTSSSPPTTATYNFYETQREVYQGSVSSSNCSSSISSNCLLLTTKACYNGNYANCGTAQVGTPISQTDYYRQPAGGQPRLSETLYNAYGLVTDDKEYNYGATTGGAPGITNLIQETSISYASLGNGIYNKPSSVIVYDWTSGTQTTIASTSYSYDQGSVTATSGTPQHVSISGSRGNLTTLTTSTSSSASLSKTFTYYDTGNPNVVTDVNGAQTTYVYSSASNPYNSAYTASCGNSFATTIDEPLSLSRSMQWNCTGGVAELITDENGNNVTSNYTDPDFWRPSSVIDQMGNRTNITYYGETAVESALQNFNGGNSAADYRTTVDGYGRLKFIQRLQGPSSSYYDTNETDYDNLGRPNVSRMPYTAEASPSSENTSAPGKTTTYDALGRVLTVTDADNGQVSYTYTANDVLQQVSGGQTFQKQFEYDGLGRLTSVCEISSTLPNVGACGQGVPQTGYLTKYTYDALGHLLTVKQNAQPNGTQQTRSFTYDWLGRMTSESNPETGTTTYLYDTVPSPGVCQGYTGWGGDLLQVTKADGSYTCYNHDGLHRLWGVENNIEGTANFCKRFRYDNPSNGITSAPSGVAFTNVAGRLVEAETDTCAAQLTTITNEWFSYDNDGRLTDVYESTPNSGGYYHTNAAYWPTGTIETLNLYNSSAAALIPPINYGAGGSGLDGEGRITQVSASVSGGAGISPVTAVTYSTSSTTNYLGALTNVTFGSSDSDSFTYDPNTGRMLTYNFSVNSSADTGTLTWNPNGTLTKLVINDQIPGTSDSQTCNYLYDDLQRVSSANCGAIMTQNFTYDAFGNITKTGSFSFIPGYSATQNQFTSIPGVSVQYDANGNLLTDNLNSYTWNVHGNMVTVTPQPSGTTVTATYDALGRMVENNAGGSYSQIVYGPGGAKIAKCNGQTLVKAFVSLPGGAKAIYTQTGLTYFRHSDWLGSSRLTSTVSKPTQMYSSMAYAPFGEQYRQAGTVDASFTGQDQDTVSSLYDFPARRYSPSQGRWISPDPAGRAAVTLANPQSWNRYAYVLNNPLRLIDQVGLCSGDDDDDDDDDDSMARRGHAHSMLLMGGCGGGGGDDDDDDDNNNGCLVDLGTSCDNPPECNSECQQEQQYLQENCQQGLQEANTDMSAVNRAFAAWDTIEAAADSAGIDPDLLAAIGVRESGFQNIPQSGGGQGAGIYQIDLGQNPGVTPEEAYDPSWSANFAANMLANNMNTLSAQYPNLNSAQLTQATAASYNFGTGNISGNPDTIDVGTTGGNYGSDVQLLMDCF